MLDAILDALLEHDPPPHVVAIDGHGLFVPMPPAVPVKDGCLIEGRSSALQLVISADIPKVIEAWEAALRSGTSGENVHLLSDPGNAALWSCRVQRFPYAES
ncbi:MAG: hypothetical protein ACLPYS_16815 [Vulcanimicrobiaceae bacterium]